MDAALPHSEAQLEDANPEWFFQTVQERISKSAVVVTVFTGGDVSAGVEAGMASMLGRKQIIVTDDRKRLPRLLAGMPGVVGVIHGVDGRVVFEEVRSFLRETLESEGRAY